MNDLRELIGQEVIATIGENKKGNNIDIKCKIIDLHINDYYFEDKGEPIYITVNVEPINKLPENVECEDLINIPLGDIRKF